MTIAGRAADMRATNPLFNANKLKLGVFFANIGGGPRPTTAEGRFQLSWPAVLDVAMVADHAGVEAFIPLANWTGVGGASEFLEEGYEPWAWAAGLAQATQHMAIFTTVQVPVYGPVVTAKLAATIDHISGGRFCMNVCVGSWA
jgi:dimethylsulfone monooxygenase